MNNFFNKVNKSISIFIIIFLILSFGISVFSYYLEMLNLNFNQSIVSIDLLFDKLSTVGDDTSPLAVYQKTLNENAVYNPDASWGSEENPYIISHPKHLENLSVLQNNGYFYTNYIQKNFDNGVYNNNTIMPHFLISTTEGTPVTIDCMGIELSSIGTNEYPFIGTVKGAFSNGTCSVASLTSDVSTIHNLKIITNISQVDIGLFGKIGCLSETDTDPSQISQVSTISNFILSDIQIIAKSSLWNKITAFVTNHLFSYSKLDITQQQQIPNENHHIGILAGHVDFAKISEISVYYSSDNITALDLQDSTVLSDTNANYYSATMIIGFLNSMNPDVENGNIIAGSGTSNGDISYSNTGGGGLLSGTNPGYVYASEMYSTFKYGEQIQGSTDIYIQTAKDINGNALCEQWINEVKIFGVVVSKAPTGRYYFNDGVFTFALSSSSDTISQIWPDADGQSTVPMYTLGSTTLDRWEYGTLGSGYNYYATLSPITDTAQLLSDENYVVVWKDDSGNLYYLNLNDTGDNKVYSASLTPNNTIATESGGYQLTFSTAAGRNSISDYFINISGSNNTFTFTHKNSSNKLGIHRYWGLVSGNSYNIYSGKDSDGGNFLAKNYYYYNTQISYNSQNWSFYINANNVNRYITANSSSFGYSDTQTTSIEQQFHIFKVEFSFKAVNEDDPDSPKGFRPIDEPLISDQSNQNSPLMADQYVLCPQSESSASASKTDTPAYELKLLKNLNWKNKNGEIFSQVSQHFKLQNGIDWAYALNIFGASWSTENNSMINAPIGSDGTKSNIPRGCIAFKVNKVPANTGAKIRVIVSVPTSSSSTGLGLDSNASNEDYYFGIWKGNTSNSGVSVNGFNKDNAYAKIELPRSQPKEDSQTGKNEFISIKFDGNNDSILEDYNTYLQGDTYLVAYEFTVMETGVYILGASNSAMHISYFSADGVASAGRDGTGGSQLGTIDFVYDYSQKIIPVAQSYSTDDANNENYNYYYPSFCFTYLDNSVTGTDKNGFTSINDEKIYIKRWIDTSVTDPIKSTITISVMSDADNFEKKLFKASSYATHSDILPDINYNARQ